MTQASEFFSLESVSKPKEPEDSNWGPTSWDLSRIVVMYRHLMDIRWILSDSFPLGMALCGLEPVVLAKFLISILVVLTRGVLFSASISAGSG